MGSRRGGREVSLQALCALDARGEAASAAADAVAHAIAEHAGEDPDRGLADTLTRGVMERLAEIDEILRGASRNWRLERMARVDRNILRMAVWELKWAPETPPRVVLNEAIEIAKRYGTAESSGFVNGLLDRCVRDLGVVAR